MDKELELLRAEIDDADRELIRQFCRRMDVSARIAGYKSRNCLPVYMPEREQMLLESVREQAGEEFADLTETLYREILRLSREYQHAKQPDLN